MHATGSLRIGLPIISGRGCQLALVALNSGNQMRFLKTLSASVFFLSSLIGPATSLAASPTKTQMPKSNFDGVNTRGSWNPSSIDRVEPLQVQLARTCGVASYYGRADGFHGRRTASGQVFNADAMTAAHRSLPFGSRVRVVNQDTGRSVIVKINDHGPAYSSRIIDLSEGAFAQIASRDQGLARVCISRM
jgi:rare lipoprotein A